MEKDNLGEKEVPTLPIGLKILRYFNVVRLLLLGGLILNAIIVLIILPVRGFFLSLSGLIIQPLGLENPLLNTDKTIGYVIGYYWIPILAIALENLFVKAKMKIGFWIFVGIDVLILAGSMKLSLLAVLVLILVLPNSSRDYFKNKQNDVDTISDNKSTA